MHSTRRNQTARINAQPANDPFPHLIRRKSEYDFRRRFSRKPGPLLDLELELTSTPTRIAQEEPYILRRALGETLEHIQGGGKARLAKEPFPTVGGEPSAVG